MLKLSYYKDDLTNIKFWKIRFKNFCSEINKINCTYSGSEFES